MHLQVSDTDFAQDLQILRVGGKSNTKYSASITLDDFASGQTSPLLLCQFSFLTEQSVFADKDSGAARACEAYKL